MTRARRTKGREPRVALLLVAASVSAACDDSPQSSEAPRSRVQAVVASAAAAPPTATTGAAVPNLPSNAAVPSSVAVPSGVAVPNAPRAPLCQGQLDEPGVAFQPSREPTQAAAPGQERLPAKALTRNARWTWVNFWAAWCVPCKEELPLLLSWQEKLASKLDVVFVSFDDDARQLDRFLGDQPPGGLRQSYWLPEGVERSAWLEALKLEAEPELPMQLLIDPKGRLRCKIQGAIDERDLPALEKIVASQ